MIPKLNGGLQTHHLGGELSLGRGGFGGREHRGDCLGDGALSRRHPSARQAAVVIQLAKWTSDLVERGEHRGRLISRAPHRKSGGV